jgi:hypothetical protein
MFRFGVPVNDDWEAKIPTDGGWWVIKRQGDQYFLYNRGAIPNPDHAKGVFNKLSDLYKRISKLESENE